MRVLFDTNVVLDVLLNRDPWVVDSQALWQLRDEGEIEGYLVASVLSDIFYIVRRAASLEQAHQAVAVCLDTFVICPVDRAVLEHAQHLPGQDFEDNIQISCASLGGLDVIATRDPAGFAHSTINARTPQTIVEELATDRLGEDDDAPE